MKRRTFIGTLAGLPLLPHAMATPRIKYGPSLTATELSLMYAEKRRAINMGILNRRWMARVEML